MVIGLLVIGHCSFAVVKEYDGLWFLGFNLHKDLFAEVGVRKAFNHAVDREFIAKEIMSVEVTPTGSTPPGMNGYDKNLKGSSFNIKLAKKLMREAGYPMRDKRLKDLSLLHTDGVKTIRIAEKIQSDLRKIGVKVSLKQVSYKDRDIWGAELMSGRHHMFLMGYKVELEPLIFVGDKDYQIFHKVGCEKVPAVPEKMILFSSYEEALAQNYSPCFECKPKPSPLIDAYDLLQPLFHSNGAANFTYFQNDDVDKLFDQLSEIDITLTKERAPKLKKIDRIIQDKAPVIDLFYITKL